MGLSQPRSRRLLAQLQAIGLIEEAPRASRPPSRRTLFRLTAAGLRLATASGARPVHRATAEKHLGEFLTRVKEVNRIAYWLYHVKEVRLFGSILSPKERVGDIDLAIELQSTIIDSDERLEQEARRSLQAIRGGRRLARISDQVLWPRVEVLLFLKSRSRLLSLHEMDDLKRLGAAYKTIFALSQSEA
jgi:predicted nucleotidyltransferase